jgi:hypothetical protein
MPEPSPSHRAVFAADKKAPPLVAVLVPVATPDAPERLRQALALLARVGALDS